MGKFDGILICTDLDGTLFKNDKTVSPENREAIEYFKREGGYFTFITGRMPYYSQEAYDAVQPNVPYGCLNGGAIYDGSNGQYVWSCDPLEGTLDLIRCIDERFPSVGIQICCYERTYFSKDNEEMVRFRRLTRLPNLVCHYEDIDEPVAKIIFVSNREEEILGVEQTLREHPSADAFDFIRSARTLFEIVPKGVQKGLALTKLIDYLQIDPRKTVAVGDYNNDVGMLRAAGIGVAVANACREAREAADFITVSNEEHALAQVIADIEQGIYSFSINK